MKRMIMNESLDLEYDRLLGEGAYGKVFLVKQQDGEQVNSCHFLVF